MLNLILWSDAAILAVVILSLAAGGLLADDFADETRPIFTP